MGHGDKTSELARNTEDQLWIDGLSRMDVTGIRSKAQKTKPPLSERGFSEKIKELACASCTSSAASRAAATRRCNRNTRANHHDTTYNRSRG